MTASRNAQMAQPYYERAGAEEWQNQRLKLLQPQQRRQIAKRRLEAVPYVLLVMLLFCAAFGYMYLSARIGLAGREINAIEARIKDTQNLSQRVELEIGNLSSLARIESYATLHLGMVYPDVNAIQYLNQEISNALSAELNSLAVAELEPEPAPPEPERHPLLAAWSDLVSRYFSGTALAAE